MADTTIKSTTNVGHAIKYASGSNQGWSKAFQDTPHVSNKYVQNRVLGRWGNNVSSNPYDFYKSVKANHARLNLHKNNVGLIKLTLSSDPNQIDYRNPADRRKWDLICHEICKDLAPYNMSVGYGQADNNNHVYHDHCLIDPRNFINGKSITHRMLMNKVTPVVDRVEKKFGIKPQKTRTLYTKSGRSYQAPMPTKNVKRRSEYIRYHQGQYDWKADMKGKISEAVNGSTSFQQFNKKLNAQGVYLYKPYRMSKGHIRHYNGKSKLKKHFTFIMKPPKEYDKEFGIKTDSNGFVKARHKSLGTHFDKSFIFHQLALNKTRERSRTHNKPTINSIHHIVKVKAPVNAIDKGGSITPKLAPKSKSTQRQSTNKSTIKPHLVFRNIPKHYQRTNIIMGRPITLHLTKHFKMPFLISTHFPKPKMPFIRALNMKDPDAQQVAIDMTQQDLDSYRQQYAEYISKTDTAKDINNERRAKARAINRRNHEIQR